MKKKPVPLANTRIARTVLLCAVLLAAAVVYLGLRRGRGTDEAAELARPKPAVVEIAQAAVRAMDTTVSAQGTLVSPQGASARIAAVAPARLVEVRVREGDRVAASQVVAVLDSHVQQAQVRSAASALRASQLQAKQARLAARSAATENADAVQAARLELDMAETELQKLKNGARPQELAQADQAVRQAQATRDRAQTELDRANPHPDQTQGRMPNRGGHVPDLPVFAFDQFQTNPAIRHAFAKTDRRVARRDFWWQRRPVAAR
jgi:multidrug efflux pump subunit AcrA (membrane-fusion protein)